MTTSPPSPLVSHYGRVTFLNGVYSRVTGSPNWSVKPIAGFGLAVGPPLAQVRIDFDSPLTTQYAVLLAADRTAGTPMLAANYGEAGPTGFVVHLFEPVATRTLQNGGFSFAVITDVI